MARFSFLLLLPLLAGAPSAQDAHTRYDLLDPAEGAFRITYDVAATRAGSATYDNGIRAGAAISDVAVTDLASGETLAFEVLEQPRVIRVQLARPVPAGGSQRLRIEKTYRDAASYRLQVEGRELVFERELGVRRNRVVLPAGYELVACNVASQVFEEEDGRLAISFFNAFPARAPLRLVGRRLPQPSPGDDADGAATPGVDPEHLMGQVPPGPGRGPGPTDVIAVPAANSRDIVYFLRQPETHAFRLYHDYTESRPGVDRYLNVVRSGSSVSDPEALNLDTGEPLEVRTYDGPEAVEGGVLPAGDPVPEQVVVIRFPAVGAGASLRLRITETYTDAGRYGLLPDGQLGWWRSFGRSTNAVVLPEGWRLSASALPARVSELEDGRVRLDFANDRPDQLVTLIRARRR